jgi:hypothetical protein
MNTSTVTQVPRTIGDYEIVAAMGIYGGSFAKALAAAANCADPDNLARLKAAFPELWDDYHDKAERVYNGRVIRKGGAA